MFNKNTTLKEVLKTKNGKKILSDHGLPCISCPFVAQEAGFLKIGEVAERYGLDAENIVKDLNENCCEK